MTLFCYFHDGLSSRMVDDDYAAQAGEIVYRDDRPTTETLGRDFSGYAAAQAARGKGAIRAQLAAIDARSARALRTIAATPNADHSADISFLQTLETQAIALRAQLAS